MTEPPYNWSVSAAGLMFLAAIVGDFVGLVYVRFTLLTYRYTPKCYLLWIWITDPTEPCTEWQ